MAYLLSDWKAGVPVPKGWDVADAVADGWTKADLEWFMRATVKPWTPESAPDRAADGPSRAVAPSPAPEADRLAGGAAGGGAMAHPDLTAMMQRIALLRGSGKVSVDEDTRLTSCGESIAILAQRYAPDLDALRHQPLPDPGLRPDVSMIHPFAGYQPRNLPMALGYMHRVREYLARLEAKHGTGEGAA